MDIDQIIGSNIRRLRGNVSLEQLAHRLRQNGLGWTAEKLERIESGQLSIGVGELLVLCLDRGVRLSEFVGTDANTVSLSSIVRIEREDLADLVSNRPWPHGFRYSRVGVDAKLLERLAPGQYEESLPEEDLRPKIEAQRQELEKDFGKRLNVRPPIVVAAAFGLWGHSLTDEFRGRLAREAIAESDLEASLQAQLEDRIRDVIGQE